MGSGLDLAPYVPAVILGGLGSRALLGPVVQRVREGKAAVSPGNADPDNSSSNRTGNAGGPSAPSPA
jgi:hypothetical protein